MSSPTDKLTHWLSKLERLQGGVDASLLSLFQESTEVQDSIKKIQAMFLRAEEAMSARDKIQGISESVNLHDGPQNLSIRQLIDGLPSLTRLENRNVALKAKALYKYCHPDKGGDPAVFNSLRQAVRVGDAETVYLISVKLGKAIAIEDPENMAIRAESKYLEFRGAVSFRIAQFIQGGQKQKAIDLAVSHLEQKYKMLIVRLFGENECSTEQV